MWLVVFSLATLNVLLAFALAPFYIKLSQCCFFLILCVSRLFFLYYLLQCLLILLDVNAYFSPIFGVFSQYFFPWTFWNPFYPSIFWNFSNNMLICLTLLMFSFFFSFLFLESFCSSDLIVPNDLALSSLILPSVWSHLPSDSLLNL